MDPNELLEVAQAAARDAVAVHRRYLGSVAVADWSEKGAADFVTHVDREAEAVIVRRISAAFPHHDILAEEAATVPGGAGTRARDTEWLWLVDPLDGTTNFLHTYPAYSASVAVAHRGELIAGAVAHGGVSQVWTAVRGGGAFLGARRLHVSTVAELRLALVGTGFPSKHKELLPTYLPQVHAVLRQSAGVRREGSAALDLCHVATGHFDAFWELGLAPWDVAAGILMIREAGGVVTDLAGADPGLGGVPILAGNPQIHAQLRELLASVETPAEPAG